MRIKLYLLVFLTFTTVTSLSADSNNEPDYGFWVSKGISLGGKEYGPIVLTSGTLRTKNNYFTISSNYAEEFRFNIGGADYDEPQQKYKYIGAK